MKLYRYYADVPLRRLTLWMMAALVACATLSGGIARAEKEATLEQRVADLEAYVNNAARV